MTKHMQFTQTVEGEIFPDNAAWLHQEGYDATADDDPDAPPLPLPLRKDGKADRRFKEASSTDTVARSRKATKGRQIQASEARAAKRRERWRVERGITIAISNRRYKSLSPEKKAEWEEQRKRLPEILRAAGCKIRWDFKADFYYQDSGPDGTNADHLFRFGTANPRPQQTFLEWYQEGKRGD